jgi:D-3-phosphoglycerate dehydrogenase / 2-oxoglutarate reductase
MPQPHVLIADWFEDVEFACESFERAGVTWSLPAWRSPPPPRDEQHRQLLERIAAAPRIDAVLFGPAPIDAEVIDALPPTCKLLQRIGIGLDHVDQQRACDRGMVVRNTPEYCVEEVAVHAMAMLLSLHRQLYTTQQVLLSGRWRSLPPQPLECLSTLTLGIIGLGRIGRRLAEMARPLLARLAYHDPAAANPPNWIQPLALNDLLGQADMVSLHCPLTPDSRHMINAWTLALMKPTAILVNVSRGGLIDPLALAAALDASRLAGAGPDVHEPEILPDDSPLRHCQNAILTSHTAWYSRQATVDARTSAIHYTLEAIKNNTPEATL